MYNKKMQYRIHTVAPTTKKQAMKYALENFGYDIVTKIKKVDSILNLRHNDVIALGEYLKAKGAHEGVPEYEVRYLMKNAYPNMLDKDIDKCIEILKKIKSSSKSELQFIKRSYRCILNFTTVIGL